MAVPMLATLIILTTSAAFGLDPTPEVSLQQTKDHQITLTVTGSPGQPYTLQMATNLTDWSFLTEGFAPDQMDLSNLDSAWTNRPAAFFRATSNALSGDSFEGSDYLAAPQYYVYLSNAPAPLVAGVAFDLGVCIADPNGNTLPVSGWAAFALQGPDYQPVPFT